MKKLIPIIIAAAALCSACNKEKVETRPIPQDEQKSILEDAVTRCAKEVDDADFTPVVKVAQAGSEYSDSFFESEDVYNMVMACCDDAWTKLRDEDLDGDGYIEEVWKLTVDLAKFTGHIDYNAKTGEWECTEADDAQISFPVGNETFIINVKVKESTNSYFNPDETVFIYIPKQILMSMTLGNKTIASADIRALYTQKHANEISLDDAVKFDGSLTVCDITVAAQNFAFDKNCLKSEISLSTKNTEILKETEEIKIETKDGEFQDAKGSFSLTFMDAATVKFEILSIMALVDAEDVQTINDNLKIGVYYSGNSTKQITITISEDGLVLVFSDGTVYEDATEFFNEKMVEDLIEAIMRKIEELGSMM